MTQPDGATNPGDANYSSLSGWSQNTQSDWQAQQRTPFASPFGIIGGFFTGIVTGIAGIVTSIISAFLGGLGLIVGTIAAAIGIFFGALFGGFTGGGGGGGSAAPQASAYDVHLGADGMRKTIVSLQSDVQAMRFDQLPPGSIVYIDNATDGEDHGWGDDWDIQGTGTVKRTGPRGFIWDASGTISRRAIGVYTHQTNSDLQITGMVLRTLPGPGACDIVLGRVGDSGDSYVYAAVFSDRVELGCYVGGVKHVIETALGAPSAGSLWELQCGTEDNDDEILVYQNRKTIIDNTDSNPSMMGSAYRSGGLGMASGPGETIPGDVAQFTLRDLAPPSIIGSGMRVKNVSTTSFGMTHGVISTVPNGYFDTVDYCSADIDWDASQSQATINTEGHYSIQFCLFLASYVSNVTIYPAYFQNTAAMLGGQISASAGADSLVRTAVGSFTAYCRPGDKLYPGMGIASGSDLNIIGEAAGVLSWLVITKVG